MMICTFIGQDFIFNIELRHLSLQEKGRLLNASAEHAYVFILFEYMMIVLTNALQC
jgi:hypothetical protein